MSYKFYDFFAGGGMAGVGLGPEWRCAVANEIDPKKAAAFRANHADAPMLVADVASLTTADFPGRADLAWGSFPCQDLSLAGARAGLKGARSGAFQPFWRLMRALRREDRAPKIIAVENVVGALTSRGGADVDRIARGFSGLGYRFGALVADAAAFAPQSRPRLFVIGVAPELQAPAVAQPDPYWHPPAVQAAADRLSRAARRRWRWFAPPRPPERRTGLSDIVDPQEGPWRTEADTERLLALAAAPSRRKLAAAQAAAEARGRPVVGTAFRRIRLETDGVKRQRAEFRFDDVAGCLRTPAGGSSRQMIVVVEPDRIRSRLLSPREAARLMGLPDAYALPHRVTEALHLVGDGVAPPVVRWLAQHVFEPALAAADQRAAA